MRNRLNVLALLAYGISVSFILAGLMVLAGGDAHIYPNRFIRQHVDVIGSERCMFGGMLLAGGYVLWRWVLRRPDASRRVNVELQIIAVLVLLGYVAYSMGV